MGLFKSDKNLAAILEELKSENADLLERVSKAEACVEEKLRAIADLQAVHSASGDEIKAKDAEIAELKAKLANPPAAYADASEGKADAVAEGGESSSMTWAEALKAMGGDYVAARRAHPALWQSSLKK